MVGGTDFSIAFEGGMGERAIAFLGGKGAIALDIASLHFDFLGDDWG